MTTELDLDALAERWWSVRTLPIRVTSRVMAGRLRGQLAGSDRLHLGCGPNVFEGWANLDIGGGRGVTSFDLTSRLPFADASIERIYTEHFIEHVPRKRGLAVLRECARILKPGGVLRISTPDLRVLVDEYLAARTGEWTDQGWTPDTPCQMLNEGMRRWGHQFIWDEAEMKRSLKESGFTTVTRVAWRESAHADLVGLESRSNHGDLIVEAIR